MNSRWLLTRFAALWSVFFTPLLQIQARASDDPSDIWPADALAVYHWTGAVQSPPRLVEGLRKLASAKPPVLAPDGRVDPFAVIGRLAQILSLVLSTSGSAGFLDIDSAPGVFPFQVAAVLDVGDGAETVRDSFSALLTHDSEVRGKLGSREIGGVRWDSFTLGDEPGVPEALWSLQSGRLVFALGAGAAERVQKALHGAGPRLSGRPELAADREKLGAASGARLGCFVDIAGIEKRIRAIIQTNSDAKSLADLDEFLSVSGLKKLQRMISTREPSPRGRVSRSLLSMDGPPAGFFRLWKQEPLTDADLKLIPENAYFATAGNFDLRQLRDEVLGQIEDLKPELAQTITGGDAMIAQFLHFSLLNDLLPAFGDTWVVYDCPEHGGLYGSGTVLVAEAAKPEMIQAAITRGIELTKGLAAQAGPGLRIEERVTKSGTHEIHYLLLGGVPSPLAPAWGFVDGRVVLGLLPQPVALAMNQADPATRKRSCLDRDDVRDALKNKLPKSFCSFGYADPDWFIRAFYPLQNMAWTMLLSAGGAVEPTVDLGTIPTLPEYTVDEHPLVSATALDESGIRSVTVGERPILASLVNSVAPAALAASVLLPSLSRARELAKRTVSASNLRQIGLAAHIYANDHDGAAPPSFETLISAGSIVREMLYSPLDPQTDHVSYVLLPWKKIEQPRQPSGAVFAYELLFGDEGTNILYMDGHVEFQKMPEAAGIIRAAYEELGIPEQVPPEFR